MSYLLFMDESGHDHRTMPYEVRGGIAIHTSRLWGFIQAVKTLEEAAFGDRFRSFGHELKGYKLLNKRRWQWAAQREKMADAQRRSLCLEFLKDGGRGVPTRDGFTAYGQACLFMARGLFDCLEAFNARVFACAIPRAPEKPSTSESAEFLRKDHVFLFERYYHFLESERGAGARIAGDGRNRSDGRRPLC
ncbi:MAG: hypothetical protein M5R36_25535 [Deltaproteobacteria bacterium]|nr:hypothetical protein [Deltaproteobacteria bacterium]